MNKEKINALKKLKEFTKDSTLTEEDAIRLGREVSSKAAKRHETKRIFKK